MPEVDGKSFPVDSGYATVSSGAKGWLYRVFIGAELDDFGNVDVTTADVIRGGWAPTEGEARRKAKEAGRDD
jgi:hypothetical protein